METLSSRLHACLVVAARERRVRWHMASVGNEVDMHNLHIHGNTFLK